MLRFWELLAEGVHDGRRLLGLLRSIAEELPSGPMGKAARALADDVEQDITLSEAMSRQPSVFTRAHVCFVEGGERVGRLDRVFDLILELTRDCPICGNLRFPENH